MAEKSSAGCFWGFGQCKSSLQIPIRMGRLSVKGHYETFSRTHQEVFYLHAVAVLMGYGALWASGRSVPPLFFILWLIWELPWQNEDFSGNQKPQKSHLFKDRATSRGLYASGLSNAALMTVFAAIYDGGGLWILLLGIVSAVYVFLA